MSASGGGVPGNVDSVACLRCRAVTRQHHYGGLFKTVEWCQWRHAKGDSTLNKGVPLVMAQVVRGLLYTG